MRGWVLLVALVVTAACETATPEAVDPKSSPTPVVTSTPTSAPIATATAAPPVGYSVRGVTAAELPHSWRAGCPVGPSQLRMLTVPYVGWDGVQRQGQLVVRNVATAAIGRTFVRLFEQRFPIRSIRPVDDFGGSDDRSMAADNTSAFNCRPAVGGKGTLSQHSFGLAVDINPRENPYVYDGKVDPPEGVPFVQRSPSRKGMIAADGPVAKAFAAIGWKWGGAWHSSKDYQHFSSNGR